MKRQDIQEDLVKLFLRLNGYFTTGLIIHSPTYGKNQTELDTIAIRFPFHNQADRTVPCSAYLQIPENTVDIIIGEVKSGKEGIQFNSALRNNRISLEKLINWIGAFDSGEANRIVDILQNAMTPELINTPDNFNEFMFQNGIGNFSIRPIIFSIDRPKPKRNQARFIYGQLMLDFIWDCFRPEEVRQSCSIVYDLNIWGHSMLPIIEYFKDSSRKSVGTINDFYKHFDC